MEFDRSRRSLLAGLSAGALVPWARLADLGVADLAPDNLQYAPLTTVASAIRSRAVSSREVVEACLRRIESVNPKTNAIVVLRAEEALAAARRADQSLRSTKTPGPLHGVPFTIKDSIDTEGVVTTAGTIGWARRVPAKDATVVARLKAAGGILLGKTNTPEFTWSDETDNAVYGKTSNPYDLTRTTGGSSGGPAAAIATGSVPFDIGSDTGNSIRMPAHFCGLAGLKPTHGRIPKSGHAISYRGIMESWTQLGPIARFVGDLTYLMPIISGVDDEDPHAAPVVLREPARVSVRSLRVIFFTDSGVRKPTPETVAAVQAAAKALEASGARVEERLPNGLARANELWHLVAGADGGAWLRRLLAAAGTPGDGTAGAWFADAKPVSSDQLSQWVEEIDRVRAELRQMMSTVDLIVCPVMPVPAVKHGGSLAADYGDSYNEPHNITGWPAGTVRVGTSPEGLPIGVQVVARAWREDLVLAGLKAIESSLGGFRPPTI